MPTAVYFIGSEKPVRLADDYQFVESQLHDAERGQFNLDDGGSKGNLVTIYKSAVAYIEDAIEGEIPSRSDLFPSS